MPNPQTQITFNANGVKVNGKHIHGYYEMNGLNGYMDNSVPNKSIIITLDYPKFIITPNNRNYKKALSAYKKARTKDIQKEMKYLEKQIALYPKNAKVYQSDLKSLEIELNSL